MSQHEVLVTQTECRPLDNKNIPRTSPTTHI